MADNIPVTPGSGATVAADDISGVLHQRVKLTLGADGVNDGDVSSSNPIPVSGPVSVSSSALPTGASTSALQTTGNSSLSSIDTKTPALVSGRVPVDGSGVTQPVSIAASVAVTGPLTDTQLRASAVPVTANAGTNLNTSSLNLETTQSAMSAKLPAVLGARTIAQSMGVNIASDQVVPTSNSLEKAATGTITSVSNAVTSFTALASNANRKGFVIVNDSTTTVSVAFAATASTTAFTLRLTSNASYFSTSLPVYTGIITAIATAATGSLRVTELT